MVFVDVTLLPNPSSAGKTIRAELQCPCKSKKADTVGRPSTRSSFLRHPDALFFCETSDEYRKRLLAAVKERAIWADQNGPGRREMTAAGVSAIRQS